MHLGMGAKMIVQEKFTGSSDWYERYSERSERDGVEGRLLGLHTFSSSWDSWEMHPKGDELVICVAGRMTLLQEVGGQIRRVTLAAGDAAINPPGVWHTADIEGEATALFVTAGLGTEGRPRAGAE